MFSLMQLPIYLDHHSTTPVDPRVLEEMLPYFSKEFGNAASRTHPYGWRAQEALEKARSEVQALLGAGRDTVIFTSGATESDNLAVFGAAEALRERGDHIVTSAIEHHAVLDAVKTLEKRGFSATFLKPDRTGRIEPDQVAEAITPRTVLVSIMTANNEIGTVNPVGEIAAAARARGVLFHTDAAQAVGKIPLNVGEQGIDILSLSAHKLYGPKGVGALYVRRSGIPVKVVPLFFGGGHERGVRPGTPNVPGAVGLAAALRIAARDMEAESRRVRALRDRLHQGITAALDGVSLNGHETERLPGSLNLSFRGVPGEALLVSLRDVAVSSGSACTSASVEPSYVLRAIGVSAALAHASIRFGLGRWNTEEEIDHAVRHVVATVQQLRAMHRTVVGRSRGGAGAAKPVS